MLKIFDSNEKKINKYKKIVKKINSYEDLLSNLNDDELKNKTVEFKERYTNGEKLEKILPEAYAVVREASKRVLGMRHYDVQMIGGIVLHEGNISEMRTGEGKTLVSTLPAYLNGLTGEGVHIITANEYLAERDSTEMGVLFNFLGLTVGLNLNSMDSDEKRNAYSCDITYGTNSEFGFDYLRDNMVVYKDDIVQNNLKYAIIDEVDSILIDEARTPLIISGQSKQEHGIYETVANFLKRFKEDEHYKVDLKKNNVTLTPEGVSYVEEKFNLDNLYDNKHLLFNHHLQQGLKAKALMKKDVQYVVQDGEILIVDEFTGRIMDGRRYSDGLHQAIEAKEGLKIKNESMTLATITIQNYFRMYEKLSGMTGTAKTEENEFWKIYELEVIVIPTNKPVKRKDEVDKIYRTEDEKYDAVVREIIERNKTGQPILVGTTSIENSEILSNKLKKKGVIHNVLNAKHHEKEAEIVANAGQKNAVTIATNMAGRGTDIKLGENVQDLGGLHIIGTERHESRRIDNQLRGRSGRQGDPGSTEFIISVEDEIMKRFGSESIGKMMDRLGIEKDEPIESKMITRAIQQAQKRVEGNNFDMRKRVLEYDDVMNEQRKIIYSQRKEAILKDSVSEIIDSMSRSSVERQLNNFIGYSDESSIDFKELIVNCELNFLPNGSLDEWDFKGKNIKEIKKYILDKFEEKKTERRKEAISETISEFEKLILLKTVDSKWIDQIDAMDQLRQGIHLRAYGQNKPVQEYQLEGFNMFSQMIESIEDEITLHLMKAEIGEPEREEVIDVNNIVTNNPETIKKPKKVEKLGRNSLCPCGSGKKYKNCHGN